MVAPFFFGEEYNTNQENFRSLEVAMKMCALTVAIAMTFLSGCAAVRMSGEVLSFVGDKLEKVGTSPQKPKPSSERFECGRKSDCIEGY